MDFQELYQDVILDHSRKPRNFAEIEDADVTVHADNPMCGDDITVYLKMEDDDQLRSVHFSGSGCSICMASASLMTLKLRGRHRGEAEKLSQSFQHMITQPEEPTNPDPALGDLQLLSGVRKFPMRAKCATLAWHALDEALAASLDGKAKRDISVED